jgi:hypothetical protein
MDTGSGVSPRGSRPLLPEAFARPITLAWTALLPQSVLLLLNLASWWLVSGEVNRAQARLAAWVLTSEWLLLAAVAALSLRRRSRPLPLPAQLGVLALNVLYLWFSTQWIGEAIPPSVTAWVLPVERVIFHQFALVMPAVFHAALVVACRPLPLPRGKDLAFALGLAIAVPLAWFAALSLIQHFELWRWGFPVPEWFALALVFLSALLCVMALLRACAVAAAWIAGQGARAWGLLVLLVGIAAPLGGLWLNRSIPFPADFQDPAIYALAILNGLFLLPRPGARPRARLAPWLGQCLFLPFTLYFFLVFLPFLPLALGAILAAGAGFLVLAPVALFMVHGWALLDGFSRHAAALGRRRALALGLAAAALMPAWLLGNALLDRASLRSALDYAYSPNPRAPARFHGSPAAVRRSLARLAAFKDGVDMPFLSEAYEQVVFGGMVLPDDKMERLHRVFFGEGIAARSATAHAPSIFRMASGRQPSRGPLRPVPPPARDVRLAEAITQTSGEGGCQRARVTLRMENPSPSQGEFVADLALPPGVLVSGYWLNVGKEQVPGRIFEKKSALWVYQMIRDVTRRDPGLLYYADSRTLRLHVFPFAPRESRTCEIEFLFPEGLAPVLRVGDRAIPLAPPAPQGGAPALALSAQGGFLVVPPDALGRLPPVARQPYLHFLVDRSVGAPPLRVLLARARAIAGRFPGVREGLVSAGNYEWLDLTSSLVPLEGLASLDPAAAERALPARGGFCHGPGMKRALVLFADRCAAPASPNPWLLRYPIFVVLRAGGSAEIAEDDLAVFAEAAPEAASWWLSRRAGHLEARPFGSVPPPTSPPPPNAQRTVLLKAGPAVAAALLPAVEPTVLHLPNPPPGLRAEVFDPARGGFRPLEPLARLDTASRYAQGAAVLALDRAFALDPSACATGLARLVRLSRASGILAPATSYIVVENSALWKRLQLAEKQKLANQQALEFTETPEPSTWLALGGGLALLALLRRKHPIEQARGGSS